LDNGANPKTVKASWQWGSSRPSGEVAEVVAEGEATIESLKGNTISKTAKPDDPAVHLSRPGNDVVKNASELDIEPKASGGADGGKAAKEAENGKKEEEKAEEVKEQGKKPEENGHAQIGEKRDHDKAEANGGEKTHVESNDKPTAETADAETKDEDPPAKRQKTESVSDDKKNGDAAKKGRGRPKKGESNGSPKGPAKKKEPKKAATETGEPRRSGRNSVSK
jgi:hypothetical protein